MDFRRIGIGGIQSSIRLNGSLILAWLCLIIFTVVTVGSSLIGKTAFIATDLLSFVPPWNFSGTTDIRNSLAGDTIDFMVPNSILIIESMRNGIFSEWNPYQAGGMPLSGLVDYGMFSPLSIPWWLLPPALAPGFVKLLEIATVTLGFSLLLRRYQLAPETWPIASLIFTSSGFMTSWTNWTHTRVAAFIPLFFWGLEYLVSSPKFKTLLATALPLAAMLLGGFPAITAYALYFGAGYVIFRAFQRYRKPKPVLVQCGWAILGVSIAFLVSAFALLPFAVNLLSEVDTVARAQTPDSHLSPLYVATLTMPWALGTPAEAVRAPWWYLQLDNLIEGWSYIGAPALVLVIIGITFQPKRATIKFVVPYYAGALILSFLLIYIGDPLLGIFQRLPIFSDNFIGRLRVMFGFFAAVLGAFGLQYVLSPSSKSIMLHPSQSKTQIEPIEIQRQSWLWFPHVARAIVSIWLLFTIMHFSFKLAHETTDPILFAQQAWIAVLLGLAAITVGLFALILGNKAKTRLLAASMMLLVSIPASIIARQWWPQTPLQSWYPRMPTHNFLISELGDSRYVQTDFTMWPGTNTVYGLRSLTGRGFSTSEWRDILLTVDPDAMMSPTFSRIYEQNLQSSIFNPILNRFGVKFFVADSGLPILGTDEPFGSLAAYHVLNEGNIITTDTLSGSARGIMILSSPLQISGSPGALFRVNAYALDETELANTTIYLRTGELIPNIALNLDDIPDGLEWFATIQFIPSDAIRRIELQVPVDQHGHLIGSIIRPNDDQLNIVHTGDTTIYERLNSLPRVRWASQNVAERVESARLSLLANPATSSDLVVLNYPDDLRQLEGNSAATILDNTQDFDSLSFNISTNGPGWLVIADSFQRAGWTARVNGSTVPLVAAEHAAAAVFIEDAGNFNVEITYRTPYLRTGAAISLVTVGSLTAVPFLNSKLRFRSNLPKAPNPPSG